jgi:hypothetical protein
VTGRHTRRIKVIKQEVAALRRQVGATLELLGAMEARRVAALPADTPIGKAEFRIYSQFGDDGIIQFLIAHLPVPPVPVFVEFGVDDYREANTRFLLVNKEWRGLVLDGRADLDDAVVAQNLLPMHYQIETKSAFIPSASMTHVSGKSFVPNLPPTICAS